VVIKILKSNLLPQQHEEMPSEQTPSLEKEYQGNSVSFHDSSTLIQEYSTLMRELPQPPINIFEPCHANLMNYTDESPLR
jgi:hypothetical protein